MKTPPKKRMRGKNWSVGPHCCHVFGVSGVEDANGWHFSPTQAMPLPFEPGKVFADFMAMDNAKFLVMNAGLAARLLACDPAEALLAVLCQPGVVETGSEIIAPGSPVHVKILRKDAARSCIRVFSDFAGITEIARY